MTSTAQLLNQETLKESQSHYKKATKALILAVLKKAPREILIETLKDLKIIERDWVKKGEKYKLK